MPIATIDRVGNRQRALEHVEMPVGQRVEGAGIDGDAFGHGSALLAHGSNSKAKDARRLAMNGRMNGDISKRSDSRPDKPLRDFGGMQPNPATGRC